MGKTPAEFVYFEKNYNQPINRSGSNVIQPPINTQTGSAFPVRIRRMLKNDIFVLEGFWINLRIKT